MLAPAEYDAWYQTPRGVWISNAEFRLVIRQLRPQPASTLLDVGCGTGHFSRRFAALGLQVTGLDLDTGAIKFARQQGGPIVYLESGAEALPFADGSFDYCVAITSLCFIEQFEKAIDEMWRVSRKAIVLGLLNRNSLLFKQKDNHGSYIGARWDRIGDVSKILSCLKPGTAGVSHGTAIFLPWTGCIARTIETVMPGKALWGGFLSVCIRKKPTTRHLIE
ncbi:MAG: class I SAM-dependent methyltransferase [Acidiferrobacterales bacterium]